MISSRRKGKRGELEVAALLRGSPRDSRGAQPHPGPRHTNRPSSRHVNPVAAGNSRGRLRLAANGAAVDAH